VQYIYNKYINKIKYNSKMTRSSNKKKGKISRSKLSKDGEAIAANERAIHNLKGTVHEAGKRKSAFRHFPKLLGSLEEQEAAWLLAVSDARDFAARIPVSQVTGIVPVDLYRTSRVVEPVTNANHVAFFMAKSDCWHRVGTAPVPFMGILIDDANITSWGTYSSYSVDAYAGTALTATPDNNVTLPTGCASGMIGAVSSDLVNNAYDGTEYIQVGAIHTLTALNVANAAADARYSGRVTAFYTLDPEREPLQAKTLAQLLGSARAEDSPVYVRQYNITENGLFVPLDQPDAEPLAEISIAPLPLNTECYQWRRIGEINVGAAGDTITGADCMFYIEAPAGTTFEVESTYLWQTERFASHKVSVSGRANPDGSYTPGQLGGYLGSGMSYSEFHGSELAVVPNQHGNKTPSRKPKPRKPPALHRGQVAPAVINMAAAQMKRLGLKPHPALPVLAVTSTAAQLPGVHRLMQQDPSSLSNIIRNPALREAAAAAGPAALEMAASASTGSEPKSSGFSWKKLLSGVWDVAKIVGPVIASLL
jgi:hypothetical protein